MTVEREDSKEKRLYRKIEVRMWGDEKFRALSPMPPSGQSLWFYLLTGPHTNTIPGLFRSGRAAMAEELDWEHEAFDEAFREVFQQGMAKADWKAKVVWVPKVINCNPPANPNVVTSWRHAWGLLPECELKREAYESLRAFVCGLGKPFEEAFVKAIRNPLANPLANQIAANRKQETEEKDKVKTIVDLKADVADSQLTESALDAEEPEQAEFVLTAEQLAPEQPPAIKPDVEAELLDYLNARAGRAFEPVESNRKLVRARLAEGATPEKIRAVIDAKVEQWQDDPKMAQYLQPATLFNSIKFAQYVGALGARMPTLTPMRAPRPERFDPIAYANRNRIRPEAGDEQADDYIDV
ncbi:conserved phage C-terminal domain-containing protein [Paraburkholderia sediminicola]|uniref:conserved phage C-terminal domain-containing protein n=1 Tax=Paraburkholderia sediminicola TaxID=458836 RepID=UPI0038BB6FCF